MKYHTQAKTDYALSMSILSVRTDGCCASSCSVLPDRVLVGPPSNREGSQCIGSYRA